MKNFTFFNNAIFNYSQSIYNKVIPYEEVFTFQVKIISMPNRYVGIGVVDYEKIKNSGTFYNSGNIVGYYCYYQNQGHKYPG